MQVTGMLYGSKMLRFVGFPTSEVLGPAASEDEIKALIDQYGEVIIKPVFKGGVGKKGKAGLVGRAKDLKSALKEKERLYFVEHRHGIKSTFASKYRCHRLLLLESFTDIRSAISREKEIKGWTRAKKLALIVRRAVERPRISL